MFKFWRERLNFIFPLFKDEISQNRYLLLIRYKII